MQLRRIKQRTIARHKAGSLFYRRFGQKTMHGTLYLDGEEVGGVSNFTLTTDGETVVVKRNQYGRPVKQLRKLSFTMQFPSVYPERLRLALYGE